LLWIRKSTAKQHQRNGVDRMNVFDVIKQLPEHKQKFVRYHFNLWFDKEKQMTEGDFLRLVGRQSMAGYERWMKTDEFKHITSYVLASRAATDLIDIYNVVSDKAKRGDDKAIATLIKLQKEIQLHKNEADKVFDSFTSENDEDELVI